MINTRELDDIVTGDAGTDKLCIELPPDCMTPIIDRDNKDSHPDDTHVELLLSFFNIDLCGKGHISIQDLIIALRKTNPDADDNLIARFESTLQELVPVYSQNSENYWTFTEFSNFMAECSDLERLIDGLR